LHSHDFNEVNPLAERRTRLVVGLTVVMMVVELIAGWIFHSMALLADGWHMSSHAIALGLSAAAYTFSRRLASDDRFAFGTWKIEILGGYTSAVVLVGVAGYMAYESVTRLFNPVPIVFDQAIAVAASGLIVNLVSAWLLRGASHHHGHGHDHGHGHSHDPGHDHAAHADHDHVEHHDLNLRSAYIHVAADAATSVLALIALTAGKFWGATWLDAVTGLVGSVVVVAWAITLLRDTGRILLDAEMDAPVVEEIRTAVRDGEIQATIQDLHVWRVGRGKYACVLSVATPEEASADDFRELLAIHPELVHVTVEVNRA
jgi:cation diffusion facilitator family transporter